MKVAEQARGDLLRGAEAGRNGYETGIYDAFLACVQASARGVKLPPFMVGEAWHRANIALRLGSFARYTQGAACDAATHGLTQFGASCL